VLAGNAGVARIRISNSAVHEASGVYSPISTLSHSQRPGSIAHANNGISNASLISGIDQFPFRAQARKGLVYDPIANEILVAAGNPITSKRC
jgi:hypothetical protein